MVVNKVINKIIVIFLKMEFLIGVILFFNISVCKSIGIFDYFVFFCIIIYIYFKIFFMQFSYFDLYMYVNFFFVFLNRVVINMGE